MIISVEDLKKYITTTEPDAVLESKMEAIEQAIRKYTNNNFQVRGIRTRGNFESGKLYCDTDRLKVGDTIQITDSDFNLGLIVIKEMSEGVITCADCIDEEDVLATKVFYPVDVTMGAVNMIKWDLENRDKVGIQSETISRHSVTYFNMDGDNSIIGYPKSLLGFLKPYMKARF